MEKEQQNVESHRTTGKKIFEVSTIPFGLALLASALIGWWVSTLTSFGHEWLAGIACGVLSGATLGVRSAILPSRLGTMIKADCWMFFVISLCANVALALWCPDPRYYLFIDGLLLIVFLTSVYRLSKADV